MRIEVFNNNIYEENAYLVIDKQDTTLIDPGFNYEEIIAFLESNKLTLCRIFLTHGHLDHIGDLEKLYNKYNDVSIYISKDEVDFLYDNNLNLSEKNNLIILPKSIKINTVDDETEVAGFIFYKAPGHTVGSMIIKKANYLFTGDTLFKNAVGRIDFPTGDIKAMRNTLKDIPNKFSMSSIILPGHNEKTTLKEEFKTNHYLNGERRG